MNHLRALHKRVVKDDGRYPFTIPAVQSLTELAFTTPVTFFVGANGSGKSTLLEAIACAAGSIPVGSENLDTDKTLAATYSPILMAYPGATIFSFDESPIQPVVYDDLEHVAITRSFLNNPEQYLRHL